MSMEPTDQTTPVFDGDWRLIGHDAELQRTMWMQMDRSTGEMHFRVLYNVDDILNANREARNLAERHWKGEYLHHVASMPISTYEKEFKEAAGQKDEKYMAKWLNDPDNRGWRTKEGHL